MTHVTWRLTANNRDQLRNPTLGSRVRARSALLTRDACVWCCVGSEGAQFGGEGPPQSTAARPCVDHHVRSGSSPVSPHRHHRPRRLTSTHTPPSDHNTTLPALRSAADIHRSPMSAAAHVSTLGPMWGKAPPPNRG